jgi:hypothetical protein
MDSIEKCAWQPQEINDLIILWAILTALERYSIVPHRKSYNIRCKSGEQMKKFSRKWPRTRAMEGMVTFLILAAAALAIYIFLKILME